MGKMYYTRTEVAQLLGISVRTLDRMRKNCTAPEETLIGKNVRFSAIDMRIWMKEHNNDNE